jgi:hypothetical protein
VHCGGAHEIGLGHDEHLVWPRLMPMIHRLGAYGSVIIEVNKNATVRRVARKPERGRLRRIDLSGCGPVTEPALMP